jgi:hypothetical protein
MPTAQRVAWPPASPYVWTAAWDGDTQNNSITLTVNFDSPVNGGGTLALQGIDYDIDPGCPWRFIIIDKPDHTRIALHIQQGGRSGTFNQASLSARGLNTFSDIAQITVGENAS